MPSPGGPGREAAASTSTSSSPLLIDVETDLLRTDPLAEAALAHARAGPSGLLHLVGWSLGGKARLRRELAGRVDLDPYLLPVRSETAAAIEAACAAGREVRFIGPRGDPNLARKLADCFGARLVEGVGDAAKPRREPAGLRTVARAMRVHQWAKNALVAVPLILGGRAFDPDGWAAVLAGLALLCLLASSTYVLNDLWDIEDDRRHWTKRERPFASGRLSIAWGLLAAPVGIAVALAGAALLGADVFLGFCAYLGLTLAYSFRVKRIMVLDAFTLASLFTLRLVIGIALADVPGSPWLLVFSMFLFASLAFAKRHTEVLRVLEAGGEAAAGRGYLASDGPLLIALGVSCGMSAVLVMVLYLIEEAFRAGYYATPAALWMFPCALFVWLGRLWTVSGRGELTDDPVVFALKDKASLLLGAAMAVAFVAAVWPARFLPW